MAMTVGMLLGRPRLQLTLIGGEAGLDREVSWAHVSDLPDPWDYLGPNELLLTNGTGMGASPAAQVRFAERLARLGVSGLVVGLGTGGAPVTPELAGRACELCLPLLTVPYSVRFSDIVRAIAEDTGDQSRGQLSDLAQFYDLLRLSLAAGGPGPETFGTLGQQLGLRLHLVDAQTGASVFDNETVVPLGLLLARSVAQHNNAIPGLLPLTSDGDPDGDVCALAVAVPGEPMTALVAEPVGGHLPSPAVLQHVAIAGAVQLAQLASDRQRRRRQGADLLARLLDGHRARPPEEPGPDGPDLAASVLIVLRPDGPETEDALARACARAHPVSLLLRRGDLLYAVVPAGQAASWFLPLAAELGCAAGASDVVGSAGRMPEASTEALWALGLAEAQQLPVARYGDDVGLLMPHSPAEAQALVGRVLGPLLTYDADRGARLVDTVRAFVRADGSWQRAAAEVHVHKQTLGYRLRKAEELTGRGFARTQHLAEWWFAVQALDLLTACRRPPQP
ncbi:MAG TPA: PucR family transcriptional regulator [Streptosporangiaceae bacterium]